MRRSLETTNPGLPFLLLVGLLFSSTSFAQEAVPGGIYVWDAPDTAEHITFDDKPVMRIGNTAFVGLSISMQPGTATLEYSDDGEPSGTAGKPIFNQLVSHQLKDIACIVVRYFGGTKLGTSGLINAYREACRLAIESADIQEFYITRRIKIRFDYALMGQLMEIIKSLNYLAAESNYGEDPFLILEVRLSELELAEKKIKAKFLHRSVEDIEEDTIVEGLGFDYP